MNLHTDPFEDQLHESLHAAGGHSPDLDLDPRAVIGEGTRVVRRRRLVGTAGGVAAAAVIAVGSYAVLSGAAPKATSVPGTGVGSPTRVVANAQVMLSSSTSSDAVPADPRRLTLSAHLTGSPSAAAAVVTLADDARVLGTQSATLDLTTASTTILRFESAGVIAALSPGSQWVETVSESGGPGGVTSDDAELGATGWQVAAFRFEKPEALRKVRGVIRMTAGQEVVAGDGTRLSSGSSTDGSRVVYWSEALDTFGFCSRAATSPSIWNRTSTWPSLSAEPGDRVALAGSRGAQNDQSTEGWIVVKVDGPATAPALSGVPDARDVVTEVLPLQGTGSSVVLATFRTSGPASAVRGTLSWKDASGATQSWQAK